VEILKKHFNWRILSLVFFVLGVYFSGEFQAMAYWTQGLLWYWIGAFLSYLFLILAILTIFFKSKSGINLRIISSVLVVMVACWTTFVIIAGQSGF
jgi:hypothetical protein